MEKYYMDNIGVRQLARPRHGQVSVFVYVRSEFQILYIYSYRTCYTIYSKTQKKKYCKKKNWKEKI